MTDDAEAVRVTQQYLSYFQGPVDERSAHDQRVLRHLVPENRRRAYDVRSVIEQLADVDSVLELRRYFGAAILTSLIRIEGRPVGLIANNPAHLGGAIDADGADKAEETAQVRHFGRMFVSGASLTVPLVTVVWRKGYGLGRCR